MTKTHRRAAASSTGPVAPHRRGLDRLLVAKAAGHPTRGKLVIGALVVPCALGRSGVGYRKREGDGVTPSGRFRTVAVRLRTDRMPRIRTELPSRLIGRHDGWCDDPASPLYNRLVRLPSPMSHETLWRDDGLYDIVVMLDYNFLRPLKGRGSAIFFHLARPDWRATAGCIAIRPDAMRRLLPRLTRRTRLDIRI